MEGIVMKSTGSWYQVLVGEETYACRLRGKFKIKGLKVTNPIAVGDRVVFSIEDPQENTGLITHIHPRDNYIIRKSTRKSHHGHIIAANLDQAILVATLVFPRTSLGFIDRFLVSAESFRIPSVVVFNKIDLLSEELRSLQTELINLYESIGYRCLAVSALSDDSVPPVNDVAAGKVSLFSGHSGVGKSTLLNRVAPELGQRTAEVSTFANKGVHTTTYAEMFRIAPETFVIDTPGIKELGLMDINEGELSHYFPEMRKLLGECRFHNCIHREEPGCAVRAGIATGTIDESRYRSYLSMLEDEDNRR